MSVADMLAAARSEKGDAAAAPAGAKPAAAKAKPAATTEEVSIMDKAVNYIKGQTDKQKAFDSIMSKYENDLSDKQKAGLKKFVR